MLLASLTRRFVSAKTLQRPSEYIGKLVEHHAQSPVRKKKKKKNPRQTSQKTFHKYLASFQFFIVSISTRVRAVGNLSATVGC